MTEKQAITINSAVLYIIAFLLTTMIHEFLHAIAGLSFGSNPVIHHNFVEHLSTEHLSINQKVFIALAGPLISLLQGIVASILYLKFRSKAHKLTNLFLLWFSVLGFFNFLGYLMTGFLFKVGDIGKAFSLANTPFWIQIVLSVIASLMLVFIAYKMTAPFLKFSYKKEWVENGKSRKNFSFHILFLPWIIGSGIITVLYLPVIALISIIYPVLSGMIFIFPWQNANRITDIQISTDRKIGKISFLTIGLLLLLIILFKFILAPGVEL